MPPVDIATMTGLDLMRWVQTERPADVPSIGRLLGMRFDEVEHGRVVISLDTQPDFANPLGNTHGGIAATLLDSVMGCAVHTTLAAGVGYTTLELKVNYIRTVPVDGRTLTAEGTVLLAASQSQGRGRMGRPFYSPADTGVYLSLLLRPKTGAAAGRVRGAG